MHECMLKLKWRLWLDHYGADCFAIYEDCITVFSGNIRRGISRVVHWLCSDNCCPRSWLSCWWCHSYLSSAWNTQRYVSPRVLRKCWMIHCEVSWKKEQHLGWESVVKLWVCLWVSELKMWTLTLWISLLYTTKVIVCSGSQRRYENWHMLPRMVVCIPTLLALQVTKNEMWCLLQCKLWPLIRRVFFWVTHQKIKYNPFIRDYGHSSHLTNFEILEIHYEGKYRLKHELEYAAHDA